MSAAHCQSGGKKKYLRYRMHTYIYIITMIITIRCTGFTVCVKNQLVQVLATKILRCDKYYRSNIHTYTVPSRGITISIPTNEPSRAKNRLSDIILTLLISAVTGMGSYWKVSQALEISRGINSIRCWCYPPWHSL